HLVSIFRSSTTLSPIAKEQCLLGVVDQIIQQMIRRNTIIGNARRFIRTRKSTYRRTIHYQLMVSDDIFRQILISQISVFARTTHYFIRYSEFFNAMKRRLWRPSITQPKRFLMLCSKHWNQGKFKSISIGIIAFQVHSITLAMYRHTINGLHLFCSWRELVHHFSHHLLVRDSDIKANKIRIILVYITEVIHFLQ